MRKDDTILQNLDIEPGRTVADLGSGGGKFSLRLVDLVGETGIVYAGNSSAGLPKQHFPVYSRG